MIRAFILVLAAAISLRGTEAFEYCCVKKSMAGFMNQKSKCTVHITETESSAVCKAKYSKIIVKDFDSETWKHCCVGLKMDTKSTCLNHGCYKSAYQDYAAAKENKKVGEVTNPDEVTNPMWEEPLKKTEEGVSGDEEGVSGDKEKVKDETVSSVEDEAIPKGKGDKGLHPCVSPDGNYLVSDCIATIMNRKFQNLVDYHFRTSSGEGLKKDTKSFTFVSPMKEREDVAVSRDCGDEFPPANIDRQRKLFCGIHAINNALMLPETQKVNQQDMKASIDKITANLPVTMQLRWEHELFTPGVGFYSIYVVGDALSKKSGRTVHQYSTRYSRFQGMENMMDTLQSKDIIIQSNGHYTALRPLAAADQWCYIDSLGGGKLMTMTSAQVQDFLLSNKVNAFLTVDHAEHGGGNAEPFENSQETYEPENPAVTLSNDIGLNVLGGEGDLVTSMGSAPSENSGFSPTHGEKESAMKEKKPDEMLLEEEGNSDVDSVGDSVGDSVVEEATV